MTLHISGTLDLPLEWLQLASIIYGMPGTGKSVLSRVVAEEAHKARVRFCIFDITGGAWGLKSSADGKHDGLPVVIFGGDHADMPLNIKAGRALGETIAELGQSTILDLEHFDPTEYLGFIADFSRAVLRCNRKPLVLIYDEVQEYGGQNSDGSKDGRRCLGAVRSVAKTGRKHALGRMFLTQRGAEVNKAISEVCETLVSFRAQGTLDQDRIKKWLGNKVSKENVHWAVSQLNGLPDGTALFASAHPKSAMFGVHAVRRPDTFDSSATPELGQTLAEPVRLSKPELEELQERLAATIEEALNEDPAALRVALAEEKRLRLKAEEDRDVARLSIPASAQVIVNEIPMWDPDAFAELESKVSQHWQLAVGNVRGALHVYKSKCMESNGATYGLGGTPRPTERQTRLLAATETMAIGPRERELREILREAGPILVTPSKRSDLQGWTQMEEDLYQKFKARLLKEAQEDPAILRVLAQCPELEISQEKVLVEVDGKSLRGRIAQLAASGFFADSRLTGQVFKELNRTGAGVNSGNVSRELTKLVAFGILTKENDGFMIAPGAKVRLKKAS